MRALQQQVNALMGQNVALEAQLVGQQNIAQGLSALLGAITTVLSHSKAPMKMMLVDPKGLGTPSVFSTLLCVDQGGREQCLTFAAESQDEVIAATIAIGVLELGVESAEIDGQLFVEMSALTKCESFDIFMSARGDCGFESWRKLHGR